MKIVIQDYQKRQHMVKGEYEIYHYQDQHLENVDLHHHDFYEIFFFISGKVTYYIEGKSYTLRPNDILLIGPNELHQPFINSESEVYERIVLWINSHFLKEVSTVTTNLAQCFDLAQPGHRNLLRLDPELSTEIKFELFKLLEATNDFGFGSDLLYKAFIIQILITLNRYSGLSISTNNNTDIMTNDNIQPVLDYISNNLSNELNLDCLASKFYLSKFHLMREFKKYTGTTIHRYILQKRLILAKQYLLENMPVIDVYSRCGFNDYSNFFRAFKAEYGLTPKEFYHRMNG